jgi:hypothetical protein
MEVYMRTTRLIPLLAVAALGGCGLFGGGGNAPLIADARSPIVDVPVPAGFTMSDDSTSKLIPGSGLRLVNHRYTGHDDLLPVVNFYKDHMPQKEWVWLDQNQPMGKEIVVHFTKKGEECYVTVTKRMLDTVIGIRIDPLTR